MVTFALHYCCLLFVLLVTRHVWQYYRVIKKTTWLYFGDLFLGMSISSQRLSCYIGQRSELVFIRILFHINRFSKTSFMLNLVKVSILTTKQDFEHPVKLPISAHISHQRSCKHGKCHNLVFVHLAMAYYDIISF